MKAFGKLQIKDLAFIKNYNLFKYFFSVNVIFNSVIQRLKNNSAIHIMEQIHINMCHTFINVFFS